MTKINTIIRFTQVQRRTRVTRPVWVKSAKFADGPGFAVKSISYTTDRNQAAPFSLGAAHDIAAQFYKSPAYLERTDGTELPEETSKLHAEQIRRYRAAIAQRQAFEQDLREAFAPLLPLLLKAIDNNR